MLGLFAMLAHLSLAYECPLYDIALDGYTSCLGIHYSSADLAWHCRV